jgi:hypothetical protein
MSKVSTQKYWHTFVSENLLKFIQTLPADEVLKSTKELLEQQEDIAKMPPKDANKLLRLYISDATVKKFSTRFRADKYRKSKNKKTVQLQQRTHERLLALKELLSADSIDEVLDYALSKKYENDYNVMEARETLGESVSDLANSSFNGFLMRLALNDKRKLYNIIKSIHQEAWKMSGESPRCMPDAQQKALVNHQFVISMMQDDELAREIELDILILSLS